VKSPLQEDGMRNVMFLCNIQTNRPNLLLWLIIWQAGSQGFIWRALECEHHRQTLVKLNRAPTSSIFCSVSPSHAAQSTKQPVTAVQARKRATHLRDILHIFEPPEKYKVKA
jgi:hypothetical protein